MPVRWPRHERPWDNGNVPVRAAGEVQVTGRSADCTEQCSIQVQAGRLRGCEAARLNLYEEDSAAPPEVKGPAAPQSWYSQEQRVWRPPASAAHIVLDRGWGEQCDLDRINTTLQIFLLRVSSPSLSLSLSLALGANYSTWRENPSAASHSYFACSVLWESKPRRGGCCWCRRRLLEAAVRLLAPIDYPPL